MLWPEFPNPREMKAWWAKMDANPGSCVILTIEPRAAGERPAVRVAWMSERERQKVRKALIEVNISRGLRNEPLLTELPS
jgi:hypothetical protein